MQAIYGGLVENFHPDFLPPDLEWSGVVRCLPERLDEPLHWRKPERVFVVSQADLFHKEVPDEFIRRVLFSVAKSTRHTYLILTKRIERALQLLSNPDFRDSVVGDFGPPHTGWAARTFWPLPNVWLGVTAEDQQRADERIPLLLQVPAAVQWVSAEPLLGPLDLSAYLHPRSHLTDGLWHDDCPSCLRRRSYGGTGALDQIIVGAESGPGHRPMQEQWVRDLKEQCQAAGVAYYLKQMWQAGKLVHTPELDGKRYTEMPNA